MTLRATIFLGIFLPAFLSCRKEKMTEPDPIPSASFSFISTSGNFKAPCTIAFTNTSLNATAYTWDFGNGNQSAEVSPSYTYTSPGTYTVKLTAKRGAQADTETQTLTVDQFGFVKKFGAGNTRSEACIDFEVNSAGWVFMGGSAYESNGEIFWQLTNADGVDKGNGIYLRPSSIDEPYDVCKNGSGEFFMTGRTDAGNTKVPFVAKYSNTGASGFFKTLGDGSGYSVGYACCPAKDGGVLVTGVGDNLNHTYVFKLDAAGNELWKRSAPVSAGKDDGRAIIETPDGGYIIAGRHRNGTADRLYIARYDVNGNILWGYLYGDFKFAPYPFFSAIFEFNEGRCHIRDAGNGQYLVKGYNQFWLINGDGTFNWTFETEAVQGTDFDRTPDGGYIFVKAVNKGGENYKTVLTKTDANCNKIWEKTYPGGSQEDIGWTVRALSNGFLVGGYSEQEPQNGYTHANFYLFKTDLNGN